MFTKKDVALVILTAPIVITGVVALKAVVKIAEAWEHIATAAIDAANKHKEVK